MVKSFWNHCRLYLWQLLGGRGWFWWIGCGGMVMVVMVGWVYGGLVPTQPICKKTQERRAKLSGKHDSREMVGMLGLDVSSWGYRGP